MWLDTGGLPMSGAETLIIETYVPSADQLTMDRTMVIHDPLYTEPLVRTRFSARDEDAPLGDTRATRIFLLRLGEGGQN